MSTSPGTTQTLVPTGTWVVDPAHSSVEFAVKHMGIATVRGKFEQFEGSLVVADDLANARATGTVQIASINTGEPQRDDHLRSADFFDVASYPELSFESTGIEQVDDETFRVNGELSLHGTTRPIALEAVVQGTDVDPWGNERIGLEVVGQLNRSDYEMKFNQALGSGNMLVGDKVRLTLDISAVRQS